MSVEAFVIAELVAEGTPKRAFMAGVSQDDFELADEEFAWIVDQYESRKPITVRRFKKKFPDFDFIRSDEKLTDLIDELKQERAFVTISTAVDEILFGEDPLDNENAIRKAQQFREKLSDVLRAHSANSDTLIGANWQDHYAHVKQLQAMSSNGEISGIPTGMHNLDHHWGGLQGECSYVVLGRPGDAKSMLLGKFGVEAMWYEQRVGIFSPEMTEHQHRCRFATLLSAKREVQEACGLKGAFRNRALMMGHGFNAKAYRRFLEFVESLKGEIALFTPKYRREKMTPQYIETRIEDLGLDLAIIDPIYKLRSPRRRNSRFEEIGEIVDSLTDMAHSFNIPVVMSNQANRALVGTRGEPPTKDTSYGSDAPAQEGDVVIGVKHFSEERMMKLNCSKNRHGEPFKFTCAFWPNVGKLEDVTPIKGSYVNGYDQTKVEQLRDAMREGEVPA